MLKCQPLVDNWRIFRLPRFSVRLIPRSLAASYQLYIFSLYTLEPGYGRCRGSRPARTLVQSNTLENERSFAILAQIPVKSMRCRQALQHIAESVVDFPERNITGVRFYHFHQV